MFKKKPQIKTLSPLRSSDRRKLADEIISEFKVFVPPAELVREDSTGNENHDSTNSPTLSSIRTSLLPENCLSARFTTHAGPDAKLVSGTVYVGAHPGQEERILWLQMGQKDHRLYPTVYTLWQNPGLVPLLHTQDFVVDKLKTGADLMTPGLTRGPPFPENAVKNAVVAVANLTRPSVPEFVGICEIDVSVLGSVQGTKGHAVKGVHWNGDEIWAWSQTGSGGRSAPENIEALDVATENEQLSLGVKELDLDDEEEQEGGILLEEEATPDQSFQDPNQEILETTGEAELVTEPSTAEIDQGFHNAFLYAVCKAKRNGSPPHYGFKMPILPAYLISNMIQPHLPIYHDSQAQHYTIKKTSWKNAKKFIKHLDKEALIKSKDRQGNETIIIDIDFEGQQFINFTPYRLPKRKEDSGGGGGNEMQAAQGGDASVGRALKLLTLYRPSSKLVPPLLPSKTAFYTSAQVTSYLKTYISKNPTLSKGTSSARFVKLDPFIADNILGSNTSASDTQALAVGEIARDLLVRRILSDQNLVQPSWVLLRFGQEWPAEPYDPSASSTSSSLPKPKVGRLPKLSIMIEKRTGTKTVTKIAGMEVFGINPELLATDLQKKCASSTSVGQLMGGKPGIMEVLVQGDQRDIVEREVGRRGVDKAWVEVMDKTKKAGKGGTGGGGGGGRR